MLSTFIAGVMSVFFAAIMVMSIGLFFLGPDCVRMFPETPLMLVGFTFISGSIAFGFAKLGGL